MSDPVLCLLIVKASTPLPMTGFVHPRARHPSLRPILRLPVLGGLVMVLLALGVATRVEAGRNDTARYDRVTAVGMRAEAEGIRRITAGDRPGRSTARELSDLLRVIGGRAGTSRAILVDGDLRVVATGTAGVPVGAIAADAVVSRALALGGLATTNGGSRALPVDLGGRRYVYAVTRAGPVHRGPIGIPDAPFLLAALLLAGALVVHRLRRTPTQQLAPHVTLPIELARATAHATRHIEALSLILLRADARPTRSELRRIAEILHDGRLGDRAFRAGRGAFAVLLPRTGLEGAVEVAHRITHRLARAGVPLRAAAGSLQPGQDAAGLHTDVQVALDTASSALTPAVTDPAGELVSVAPDRARALDAVLSGRDLTCHYQPIWNLRSGDLLAVEALARVPTTHGFDGPSQAFDIAERSGRVHELDTLCVQRALEGAGELPPGAALFVNVAPQTLDRDADGDPWLAEAVGRSKLQPSQVVIEVTERVGARTETVLRSIEHLRAAGMRIAIDDVGVGNSGLEMLRRARPDFVKIDRSVVSEARHDPGARAVLAAIATFAAETGAHVIAEGIEDDEILELVSDADGTLGMRGPRIDAAQGYRLGRPAPGMPGAQRELALA
jgi:EAL domain-containing protein (putative c-di-GMP-specific phosphodiesterase class I)